MHGFPPITCGSNVMRFQVVAMGVSLRDRLGFGD
jgi:hypothetical protein